jgi:hypothetical protein
LLAPLALLPFGLAQWLAVVGMLAVIALVAKSWIGLTGWAGTERRRWVGAAIWTGSLPSLYLVGLQQPTGFAFGLLGLAAVLVDRRRYGWAGVVMAAALFKPQLTLIPLIGLFIWVWHERRLVTFVRGFAATAIALVGASLVFMPDWPHRFVEQVRVYTGIVSYTGVFSMFPEGLPRTVAMVGAVLLSLVICTVPLVFDSDQIPSFTGIVALLVAVSLLINSDKLVYNAVLIVFPLMVVLRRCAGHQLRSVRYPSAIALLLVGLSYGSGAFGAGFALGGLRSSSSLATHLAAFGFVASALPLWLALLAWHLSLAGERFPRRLLQRQASRS